MANRRIRYRDSVRSSGQARKSFPENERGFLKWKDGLYTIEYYRDRIFLGRQCEALAVLRDGAVLASDENGGVLEGHLVTTGCGSVHCALFRLRLPPGVKAMAGLAAGARELVVDVSGLFDMAGDDLLGQCEVEGVILDVVFRFIGPVPRSVSVA